jgi:hypothetical protein
VDFTQRLATGVSNLALIAESDPARAVYIEDRPQVRARAKLGRAYRSGRLVCGCVQVTVSLDVRLGLTRQERRLVGVRFHEPLDDSLRAELVLLLRRRGSAACRVAERIDPIELVVDDRHGDPVRVVGRLEPAQVRHGQIRDIEFGLGDLTTRRATSLSHLVSPATRCWR